VAFRRHGSWLSALWLCCHLAVLTATPVALLAHSPHTADAIACTCSHTGHDECPMHHPKNKKGCECRSTQDPDAASLVSLLGPIAVMPVAITTLAEPPITQLPTYPINKFTVAPAAPDGPPPRA
jgi:hypothetical protein